MHSTCCSVPNCYIRGGHEFSTDPDRREKWINAIRRVDATTMTCWVPSKSTVVCHTRVTREDYVQETKDGTKPILQKLLSSAVPSVVPWAKPKSISELGRQSRARVRDGRKRKFEESCKEELETEFLQEYDCQEVIIETEECSNSCNLILTDDLQEIKDVMTQTIKHLMFCIAHDNPAINFYTGLEIYTKFQFVLNTLGPADYCLNYLYHNIVGVSVQDQSFMTLMKLRRYTINFEHSRMFSESESTVKIL